MAMRWLKAGMADATVVEALRGIMLAVPEDRQYCRARRLDDAGESRMREIRMSGLKNGDWNRSHGPEGGTGVSRKRPVNGNSPRSTATAPVADSTLVRTGWHAP